jgi:hypothetical protein
MDSSRSLSANLSFRQAFSVNAIAPVHISLLGGAIAISMIIPDGFILEDVTLSPIFSPISISAPVVPY